MPRGLAALIGQMLAKQPDARPQTMAAVSQALGEILQTLGAPPRAPTPLPVPPSTPSPAPPSNLTSSTTLRASAGMTHARASSRRARWFPFVAGGAIVAVAIPALVLGLATKDPSSPQRPVSQDAAAILPADAGLSDAAQIAVSPPPPPDAEAAPPLKAAAPTATSPSPSPSGKVEKVSLKSRAPSEAKVALGNKAFEAAMRDRNLKQAKAELDAIPTTASEYPKLRQAYEALEASVIADLVARLRATSDDCETYNQIIQQAQALQPPDVAAEAMRQIKCAPAARQAPECDHEQLADRANSYYAAGKLATAINHYQAAWDCKPDPRYAEKAFDIACSIPSVMNAKLFWRRLPPSTKPRALQACMRNGITEEMLDAP